MIVVSEFVDRELFRMLGQEGRLSEDKARQITCDLISALFYLHSHRVLHRDLKPQNVLIDENGVAKLCDFGFARNMGVRTHVLTSMKGTPLYMAPEVINAKPYDHTADLWSLGCIAYELLVGSPPFYTQYIIQLVQLIQYESVKWPEFLSPDCKSFLDGLLQKQPDKRLSWHEILKHPFLKGGKLNFENDDPALTGKYPFTNDLNEEGKELLDEARCTNQQLLKSAPPILDKIKENQLMIGGNNNQINAVKTSSCPSLSSKILSSLTENSIFKKVLHSSLKKVNKSVDAVDEKKLYTSLASDFADVKISESDKKKNVEENLEKQSALNETNKTDNKDNIRSKGFKNSKTMFTLHSWDSAASVRPIENDEWLAFLQRNMEVS